MAEVLNRARVKPLQLVTQEFGGGHHMTITELDLVRPPSCARARRNSIDEVACTGHICTHRVHLAAQKTGRFIAAARSYEGIRTMARQALDAVEQGVTVTSYS